jgi:hypothetical protein
MARNMFNPLKAVSSTHDFFSDAKFEIRIREVVLPEDVVYPYGTPLTTDDGINYEVFSVPVSGGDSESDAYEGIKCLLANTIDTNGLTDPLDRTVAAYFTGGFNQNKVEAALTAINKAPTGLNPFDVAKAREIQIDIYPWQTAPVPIEF